MESGTMDILNQLKLQHKITAYEFIFSELNKSAKKLEKQIEKRETELKRTDKVQMIVSVKNILGAVDEYEIRSTDDLLDLWQNDVITNERTYEKYENKLEKLMKNKSKEKDISDDSETLKVLEAYIENLTYDIRLLRIEYDKCQKEA